MARMMKKAVVMGMTLVTLGMAIPAAAEGLFFRRVSRVQAYDTDVWRVTTQTRSFDVVVDGDGDTDLDLFVYDAVTGRFLGSDDDSTDYCIVSGRSDSGRLRLRIENLGNVWNEYELTVD